MRLRVRLDYSKYLPRLTEEQKPDLNKNFHFAKRYQKLRQLHLQRHLSIPQLEDQVYQSQGQVAVLLQYFPLFLVLVLVHLSPLHMQLMLSVVREQATNEKLAPFMKSFLNCSREFFVFSFILFSSSSVNQVLYE